MGQAGMQSYLDPPDNTLFEITKMIDPMLTMRLMQFSPQ
jgi:hypothetical protein